MRSRGELAVPDRPSTQTREEYAARLLVVPLDKGYSAAGDGVASTILVEKVGYNGYCLGVRHLN